MITKGSCVIAKKWSGEEFKGVLQYTYDDGEHCVVDVTNGRHYCVHKGEIKLANKEEEKEIKKIAKEKNIEFNTTRNNTTTMIADNEELEEALAAID